MADKLSLHTQIFVQLTEGTDASPVDIIATSPQELLDTVAALVNGADNVGADANVNRPEQAPAPQAEQAQPTPTPGPTAAQTAPQPTPTAQPGPSAAATAPAPAATPSATATTEQSNVPSVTVNDVLAPARQLLQQNGGEEKLREILGQHGASAISTASPDAFPAIKAAIEQVLGGQA